MNCSRHHTWCIPHRAESVAQARRAVRKMLADWGYGHAADDIALVVSELVTNALVHGAPEIILTLRVDRGCVRGTVTDRGSSLPRMLAADDTAVHGRGLAIVAELTRTLGWGPVPAGGKQVWFSYPLPETP